MNGETKKYNGYHALFALISLIIGSLYYRLIETRQVVFTVLFCLYAGSFFLIQRKKLSREAIILMLATIAYSFRTSIYEYDIISGLAFVVMHITALLFIASATRSIADDIIVNTVKAVIQAPFSSFFKLPVCIVKFISEKKRIKTDKEKCAENVAYIIIGLFVSIPVILVVTKLLNSDRFFDNFMSDLSAFINGIQLDFSFFSYFNIITVLVSLFVFGALYSSDTKKNKEIKIYQKCNIPFMIIATLMVLLIVIYAIFVISQLDGYICMIIGKLPENITFSEFARSGFFELCAVSCINGIILYVSNGFSEKDKGKKALKIFSYIIVIFTLFLIFTAASKMVYYISAYGFTPKRFYTLWFMLLLTIIFVFCILWLKKTEFKISRYSLYLILVMLLILFFVDFESISKSLNLWLGY